MRIVLMVSLIVASIAVRSAQAAEAETGSALPQTQRVILKWLGTAGWEIQFAQTKILSDPFLTRKQPVAGEEWKTDEEAVLKVIGGADYSSRATATPTISLTFHSLPSASGPRS